MEKIISSTDITEYQVMLTKIYKNSNEEFFKTQCYKYQPSFYDLCKLPSNKTSIGFYVRVVLERMSIVSFQKQGRNLMYSWNSQRTPPTLQLAEVVLNEVRKYMNSLSSANKTKRKEQQNRTEVLTSSNNKLIKDTITVVQSIPDSKNTETLSLKDFSDDQIITELKGRGYRAGFFRFVKRIK